MGELPLGLATALWLGILTSISPCPLATNLAAMSYIARRIETPRMALLSGALYTLGRVLVYVVLAGIIVASLLSDFRISRVLQKHMNQALGPILVLIGMVLLELLKVDLPSSGLTEKLGRKLGGWGVWGGGALGILFALSFCPISAALFFGSLLPLAARCESSVLVPSFYGIGTALPVFLLAVLLVFGTHAVGKTYDRLVEFSRWARWITGGIFIAVGIYLMLTYIFGVFSG